MKKLPDLSVQALDEVIRMGWEDRTTFEEITAKTQLSEAQVINVMRRELKPSSFRLWRKRVTGRITKHRKLFEAAILKNPSPRVDWEA